jgi:hypothetical protein
VRAQHMVCSIKWIWFQMATCDALTLFPTQVMLLGPVCTITPRGS